MNPYKPFPDAQLIKDWDKLLRLTRAEVLELHSNWVEIQQHNEIISKELVKKKLARQKEMDDVMDAARIDIWKRQKSGLRKITGYQAWYKNNVVDKIAEEYPSYHGRIPVAYSDTRVVNGVTLSNHQSSANIIELYDRIVREYKSRINEAEMNDKLLIESIKYANAHDISIEGLSSKDIIYVADEAARDEYREETIPDGTEIYLKHACSECSSYIMGERRCECGNRRIMIAIEGNLIEGYTHHPEGY